MGYFFATSDLMGPGERRHSKVTVTDRTRGFTVMRW